MLKVEKDKYIVNFIIAEPTAELLAMQDDMYNQAANLFANDLYDELISCGILDSPDILCNQTDIDELDLNDLVYYIDVKPIECIKAGVKSYVELQKLIKEPEFSQIFNQITFYSDDKIRHQFRMKTNFTEPSERIGDTY